MMNSALFTDRLRTQLSQYEPRIFHRPEPQAAVLVPVVMTPEPSVLLTVRAQHLNSHPGQVSFPGGMREPEDADLAATALRETFEEIGIPQDQVDVLGGLSTALSKDGVAVHPYVAIMHQHHRAEASTDETAEIFTVPWQFFMQQAPEFQDINRHGLSFQIPHFHYQGQHIWGLTAMILLELVNLIEGTDWPVPNFAQNDLR